MKLYTRSLAIKLLCTLSIIVSIEAKTKTSQTFMFTRPVYQNVGATTFLWRNSIADERGCVNGAARIISLYQKSLESNKVSKYFSLKCKDTLLIAGDNTSSAGSRDIRAEWLGLPSNLSGYISLKPSQHQVGAMVTYNQHLGASEIEFLADSWLEVDIPIVQVTNQMKIEQSMVTQAGKPVDPSVIAQAFNQPTFNYGAICQRKMKETGLAEIRLIFGTTVVNKDDFLVNYYSGVILPTSKKQNPAYLFSPVTGTNGHWGVMGGLNFELPLQPEDSDCHFKLFGTMELIYLFHKHEMRVFDLRGKQWSRFMQFRKKGETVTVPGVNILSQPVRVHPFCFFNLTTGFNFQFADYYVMELGYTLWTHRKECVHYLNPNCEGKKAAINSYGIAGTGTGSASCSTINKLASNDTCFVKLNRNKLNRQSGEGRGAFTQAAHGAIGYYNAGTFIGITSFYENPTSNTALKQWGIYATAGTSF
jgi:hypothetical protein